MKQKGFWLILIVLSSLLLPPVVLAQENTAVSAQGERMQAKLQKTREIIAEQETQDPKKTAGQWKNENASPVAESGLKTLQALAICLGVFLIGIWITQKMKKGIQGGEEKVMQIRSRMPLTPKTSLVLVEVEGEKVLLSVGTEQVTLLNAEQAGQERPKVRNSNASDHLDVVCEKDFKLSA